MQKCGWEQSTCMWTHADTLCPEKQKILNLRWNTLCTDTEFDTYVHYSKTNIHLGTYIHTLLSMYVTCTPAHTRQIHTNVILNNLPRTHDMHAGVCRLTHKHSPIHAHAHRPPSLSGTSLNIHHSGCSESAVNAASHSRESLKPTLSSARPPSLPSLRHTHTLSHTHL